jgi:transposase
MTSAAHISRVVRVASSEKRRALQAQGAWNPRPAQVRAEVFATHPEFFDAEDRLQVRYELLRAPARGEMSVAEACRSFGVSRQTFYTLRRAFEAQGIVGLTEAKRGRKGPLKASLEVVEFVQRRKGDNASLSGAELAREVETTFGIRLHRRTVERLMVPKSGDTSRTATGG